MATFLGDLQNQLLGGYSQPPRAFAASTNDFGGTAIDMQRTDGPVHAILSFGTVSASGLDVDAKIQESANSTGGWADVQEFTQGYNETTAASTVYEVKTFLRTKRYLRSHVSVTGTTVTSVPVAIAIFGQKKVLGGSGTQL